MIEVAGVLIIQNGKYVLQHRDDVPTIAQPDQLSVWGGKLEGDETPVEAAARELLEETGVVAGPEELTYLADFETKSSAPKTKGQPLTVYLYYIKLDDEVLIKCFEGQGIASVKVGKRPAQPLTNYTIVAIKAYEAIREQELL